jgi:hypothetical protein
LLPKLYLLTVYQQINAGLHTTNAQIRKSTNISVIWWLGVILQNFRSQSYDCLIKITLHCCCIWEIVHQTMYTTFTEISASRSYVYQFSINGKPAAVGCSEELYIIIINKYVTLQWWYFLHISNTHHIQKSVSFSTSDPPTIIFCRFH